MYSLRNNYINLDNIFTNKYFRQLGYGKETFHDLISCLKNEDCPLLKFTIYPLDSLSIDDKLTPDIIQFFHDKKMGIPKPRLIITINELVKIYEKLLGVKINNANKFDSLRFPESQITTSQPLLPREFTRFEKNSEPTIIYQ